MSAGPESNALPLASLPLSRHQLDRDYLSRTNENLFEELFAEASTRIIVLWKGSALLDGHGALSVLSPDDAPDAELLLYLGKSIAPGTEGTAFVAALIGDDTAASIDPDPDAWGDLRRIGSTLSDLDAGLFTTALALANWHRSHRFSPRTGARTVPSAGGWVLKGGDDGHDLFPRTDSAIIVGIVDADDRILLGSNALWAGNRYSLLAGFVEPGESLESAVVREVFEESGIRVTNPVYVGSQPWPFPASLMLGFMATVDPDVESTLAPDGEEIIDLRWFSREELTAALPEIGLPGHTSIARAILEKWYGGPIDDKVDW